MQYYRSLKKPKRKIVLNKKYPILLGFFLIVFFTYYLLFLSAFFNIKEVSLSGLVEADIYRINDTFSEKLIGKKIFLVGNKVLNDFVSQNAPDYKFVKLNRIYPGKIIIEMEKRNPSMVVKATNGTFIIDNENFIMGSTNTFVGYSTNVDYDKDLSIGEQIKDPILISSFKYSGSYGVVFIENNLISIRLNEGGKVILPADINESQIENLSTTLQKIIQKYTIENKEIDNIDLRFSKPLIKYK